VKEKIVPSAWLEQEGRRLDCGPHLSGAMEAKFLLARLSVTKTPLCKLTRNGLAGIFNGPRFPRSYVLDETQGVPFLGSTDILSADLSYLPMLSKHQVKARPELLIDEGWTLISCSGTVGRMALSRSDMKGMAGSQHFMRVVPDCDKVRPGYLHAYLASRYGVPLIVSGTYGSIIQHIEPPHIANLPVPRFNDLIEEEAAGKVVEAAKLRSEYQCQVRAATKKLFDSVGLQDITSGSWHKGTPDLGFVRKINSVASLRALNFNPRFVALCETVKTESWRPLGELCLPGTLRNGPRFKRIDAEPDYSYQLVGQKQIFWLRPEGRWIAKRATPDACLVPEGTTLVASHGTFGESELYCRSEFIWGDSVERAYSQDFLRVVPNPRAILPGCMFAFLRSETAFRMFRSVSIGTKLQEHHPAFTQQLPVPYPDEYTRREIHDLVVDAYQKRDRSVRLEDEALALIERAIEGIV
jgi:type I restriction enzyme S subunit